MLTLPQLLPFAIATAALALVGLAVVVWRRVAAPAAARLAAKEAIRGVSSISRILVPMRGAAYNERALELACRLGERQKAEIIAAYVIEVPLSLPLSAPLAEEEARATECLARATYLIERHGLTAKTAIERERDAARGILKLAKERQVGMVVLGINPKNLAAGESVGRATEELLRKSHIEVIVDMHPDTDSP